MNITKYCVAALSLSLVANLAHAATPGSYLGIGLGASRQDTPNKYLVQGAAGDVLDQSKSRNGLGARIFYGYNISQYFGVEAGLAKYADATYKSSAPGTPVNYKLTYSTAALDVVGKVYLPVSDSGINLYALGGGAVVRTKASERGYVPGYNLSSTTKTQVKPTAGAGITLDIPNTQVISSIEYSHVFGKTNGKLVPSTDLVTFNLGYKFG